MEGGEENVADQTATEYLEMLHSKERLKRAVQNITVCLNATSLIKPN